jgi:hypothetical protein
MHVYLGTALISFTTLAVEITLVRLSSLITWYHLASIAAIAPLGVALGLFFPVGMGLAKQQQMPETPWFWALNGVFGVLASARAFFVAIYFSVSVNFLLGAFCYLALIPLLTRMVTARVA